MGVQVKISNWLLSDFYLESFWQQIDDQIITEVASVDTSILWDVLDDQHKYELFDDQIDMFNTWINYLDTEAYDTATQMIISGAEQIVEYIPYTDAYAKMISDHYKQPSTDIGLNTILTAAETYDCVAIVRTENTIITGNNVKKIQELVSIFITNGYYVNATLQLESKIMENNIPIYLLVHDSDIGNISLS